MQPVDEGMAVVRAELCDRLAILQRSLERCRTADADAQAQAIGLLAGAYGLTPLARLAEALRRATRDACACPPALYIARLEDAIGCARRDEEASAAMLASISVRLCG
jgi:hypothetical protein